MSWLSLARRFSACVCLIALIAGCSQNGAIPQSPTAPTTFAGHKSRLTVRILIPRKHRRAGQPQFISPATRGMTLSFSGPTLVNETVALWPAYNPACSRVTGAVLCQFEFVLKPGTYAANITTYDEQPFYGKIPPGAHMLATAKNIPFEIRTGVSNLIDFTLGGVPVSLSLSGLPPSGTIGTAFGSPKAFTVVAKDADGYTIVGPYANAVTLIDSDSSGATTIATSGSDKPPAHELLSSSDTATFDYTGGPITSAKISATAAGATANSETFVPAFTLSPTSGLVGTIVSETISGAGFVSGSTTISGTGVTARNIVVNSATSLKVDLIFPEAATSGETLTITTGANSNPTQSFTGTTTGEDVVTRNDDTAAADTNGVVGNGTGKAGDLRYELLNAQAGDTIVFDTTSMCAAATCKVTLAGPLPAIQQNQTIDGGYFGRITIDGASAYRAFWVDTGTVTIANLQIQNAHANGGAGGGGIDNGGGGAGLGGALFVNKATAAVTLLNDFFTNDEANGGNGSGCACFTFADGSMGGGGGGGLDASGGSGASSNYGGSGGGGGGGGILASGTNGSTAVGATGGYGGGGGGGGAFGANAGGSGGVAFAGNTVGSGGGSGCTSSCFANQGGLGGNGGFGGGGGGGGGVNTGGNGGFGGGGGGGGGTGNGFEAANGGNGGPGGGAGGGWFSGSSGGALATISGGNSDKYADSGGGAAAGPVAFVYLGTLTITNSGASNSNSVTAGQPGGGGASTATATAGGSDANPIYNNGGTVDGSTTTGGITMPSATPSPSIRERERSLRPKRVKRAPITH